MKPNVQNWLQQLKKSGIIESFSTHSKQFHRLTSPSEFHLSETVVSQLKAEYEPGLEKGGLLLLQPKRLKNKLRLTVVDVQFIPNISRIPWHEYIPSSTLMDAACMAAIDNQLLPCIFHSHPTKSEQVLQEMLNYNQQMNTSDGDRIASSFPFERIYNLRLPEFLVICNGSLKAELFIGIYGGLVAPLSFTKRKIELFGKFFEDALQQADRYFTTPERKLFGILGVLGIGYLATKYKQHAGTALATTAAVMPSVIYETYDRQEFFDVSAGQAFSIRLPKPDKVQILADETQIESLKGNRFSPN